MARTLKKTVVKMPKIAAQEELVQESPCQKCKWHSLSIIKLSNAVACMGIVLFSLALFLLAILWFQLTFGTATQLGNETIGVSPISAPPWHRQMGIVLRWLVGKVWPDGRLQWRLFGYHRPKLNASFVESRDKHRIKNEKAHWRAEENSNLAISYWMRWRHYNATYSNWSRLHEHDAKACWRVQLTDPLLVRHHNRVWQRFTVTDKKKKNLEMFLYSAHYDDRQGPVVRLLTMHQQGAEGGQRKWWCLFWFDGTQVPFLVPALDYFDMHDGEVPDGHFHPQLITCPVPNVHEGVIPQAVSLQAHSRCHHIEQQPSNVLRVVANRGTQTSGRIGVCMPPISYSTTDWAVRFVEWLEAVRILGAEKVYVYVKSATEAMNTVLAEYEQEGFIDRRQSIAPDEETDGGPLFSRPSIEAEDMLELTDCLYRNRLAHEYLAVLNFDELIVPRGGNNWTTLLANAAADSASHGKAYLNSICTLVSSRIEETSRTASAPAISAYLYTARHTFRSLRCAESGRNFVRTSAVDSLSLRHPMRCLNTTGHRSCADYQLDPSLSMTMFFRPSTGTVEEAVEDRVIWAHLEPLKAAVDRKLKLLWLQH